MTHDELLAKINPYTTCTQSTKAKMICDNKHLKEIYPEWFALRAVVELAKPSDHDSTDQMYWKQAIIRVIEEELS